MTATVDHAGHAAPHAGALPKAALLGAALLIGFALASVALARLRHWQGTPLPAARAVAVLHLQFSDRADGAVDVFDADRGADQAAARIATIPPRSNGFMRGVLRGLARARRSEHLLPNTPFTLTRWSDGRVTLADPGTGRSVALEVFGPDNSRPFAALFAADSAAGPSMQRSNAP
jgi:putative photosynthetic complex assembly protein